MIRLGLFRYAAAAAFAAVSLASASAASAAASFVNGSFEIGPDPGVFTTLFNGSLAMPGWEVGGHSVDYIGTYWQASDGVRSVDLAGNDKGSIFQTLSGLNIGQFYKIRFDMAGNPDGGGGVKTLVASESGNQTSVFTFLQASNTRPSMGWEPKTFLFEAFDTSVVFAVSATLNNPYGPAVDNFSITGVPEPGVWALMILGFGGAGAMLRRQRSLMAFS